MPWTPRWAIPIVLLAWSASPLGTAAESASPGGVPAATTATGGENLAAISRRIDQLVREGLAGVGSLNSPATDEIFLRRVYLSIAGRIPTLDEARMFLASPAEDKRAALIDQLLESPAYVSGQFAFWADLLRAKSRLPGEIPGGPYVEFIKGALRANQPYDTWVREMLTAEGAAVENGATGYFLRDFNMPEDNMANTVRVFLGTRLECAQCHNHPFDKWTQREFFQMVAFTGGLQMRINPGDTTAGPRGLPQQIRQADVAPEVRQAALRILRPLSYGLAGGGTAVTRLPQNYQYDDAQPHEIVAAQTMFDHLALVDPQVPAFASRPPAGPRKNRRGQPVVGGAQDVGSRAAFAQWLTSPDNPRFTQVIVNRLWKRVFGVGLIEPVDNLRDDTVASHPPLLDYLCHQMIAGGYDIQRFLRILYNTDTFQRMATTSDRDDPAARGMTGPMMLRLTAEQLWDSYLTLAVPQLDTKQNPRGRILPGAMAMMNRDAGELSSMSVDEILVLAQEEAFQQKDPQLRKQARLQVMQNMMADDPDWKALHDAKQQLQSLRSRLQTARDRADDQAAMQLKQQIRKVAADLPRRSLRAAPELVRASELASPAPPGHFLRAFGQSDREQIDNAHHDPAVTQVLSLMNGAIENRIIRNPHTMLMQNVRAAEGVPAKIEVIYLSLLSRYPTSAEIQVWLEEAESHPQEAMQDLLWTLANSNEFLFVR